ncbi:hypothetical protein [Caldimonas tepidiphila]|uniref:hypothetical protein n=1 Tax=Caldimonas tepidiphila TaxID=2315841 RepID=UPI000E5AD112|nr:hypothetical protein [Caldimonas tepidiphila]
MLRASLWGAAAVALALLAGCASTEQVAGAAVRTNLVQEQAHNQMLVLNVLRAYERKPMHFTQVTTVRLPPAFGNAGLSLGLPFGGDAASVYSLGPSFNVQHSVDTAVLNTQEFMRGVTTPVPVSLMLYFLDQGWPPQLVLHMFVRGVEFYEGQDITPIERVTNYPENRSEFERFQRVLGDLRRCDFEPRKQYEHVFYSAILDGSEFKKLPEMAAVKSAGLVPVPVDRDGKATTDEKQQVGLRFAAVTQTLGFDLKNRPGGGEPCEGLRASSWRVPTKTLTTRADPQAQDPKARSVRLLIRSPEAMIYYLGEIARAQLHGQFTDASPQRLPVEPGFPSIGPLPDEGAAQRPPPETLFELKEGVVENAALTLEYGGKTYSIPPSTLHNRSMHVLWLLSQILALQNKGTDLPSTPNVRLIQ